MNRILFEKTGRGVWISHLDLMRLFQRTFKRGGMNLKHTQGFNPRAMVSIALPLSVGVESRCEILDFELVDQQLPFAEIKERLNRTMPDGVRVLEVYDSPKKIKELTHLDCTLTLEYDNGVGHDAVAKIKELFSQEEVLVTKKSKNGPTEQNIIPMIQTMEVEQISQQEIEIRARICAQNPSLNPSQIVAAIEGYCDDAKPNFSHIRREEVRTCDGGVFR